MLRYAIDDALAAGQAGLDVLHYIVIVFFVVVYAFIMNVSVAGLFAAGIVPELMVGFGLMLLTSYLAKVRNYPIASRRATWGERGVAFRKAFLPLLTPVILLGGILSGVFTPTEAAAVAAGYAAVLALLVLRTLMWYDLPSVLFRAVLSSGVILLLVGMAVAFAALMTLSQTPVKLTDFVLGISENPLVLLFLAGMLLDGGPAILILGPVLGPTFVGLDVDSLHFAIIMCVTVIVTVGLATPPMDLVLFVAASLSGGAGGADCAGDAAGSGERGRRHLPDHVRAGDLDDHSTASGGCVGASPG